MRRPAGFLLLLALALALPAPARALTRTDLFAGYAFAHSDGHDLHGWGAGAAFGLSDRFFLAADLGGQYGSLGEGGLDISLTTFTAGPRYELLRFGRATVFLHVLAGLVRDREGLTVAGVSLSETKSRFGGLA